MIRWASSNPDPGALPNRGGRSSFVFFWGFFFGVFLYCFLSLSFLAMVTGLTRLLSSAYMWVVRKMRNRLRVARFILLYFIFLLGYFWMQRTSLKMRSSPFRSLLDAVDVLFFGVVVVDVVVVVVGWDRFSGPVSCPECFLFQRILIR